MAVQKVCKQCKAFVEGVKCEVCGSEELSDVYKGKIEVLNPEQSEIAKNLKINKKGTYVVKLG